MRYSISMRFLLLIFAALVVMPGATAIAQSGMPTDSGTLPTCQIDAIRTTLERGEVTTLTWSSANAKTMYINTVGYVRPNEDGAAQVGPRLSTNFRGTVSDGTHTAECKFALSVRQTPVPTCTMSVLPNPIRAGQTAVVSWSSTRAQTCTSSTVATNGLAQGTARVSPESSMTYRITCSGHGGTVECAGNGPGGVGATLAIDPGCSPQAVYSCDGATIMRTDTTRECETSVAPVRVCEAPSFCINGAATCQYRQVTASIRVEENFIASGGQSKISWTSTNATQCSVEGNGDTWEGTRGAELTSPVTKEVTYTLRCSSPFNTVTDTVTISPLPAR